MTREFHVPTESPIGRALTQRESGDLEGAIETLMAAIGDTLADAQVAVTLAKMLDESGRGEMAVRWFRHAMKIAPDDAIVRMSYGTFLASQGHFDEAHELLEGARRDAHALLAVMATGLVDPDPALEGFLGVTETNLARAAFERGDSARARALVAPWLAREEHWGNAHGVLSDVLERDDLDPRALAEDGLATGEVSPYMACYLLEQAVEREPCDFATLDRVIGRADEIFAFDWRHAAPEIEAVLVQARQAFGRAVMRGALVAAAHPHLTTLAATS